MNKQQLIDLLQSGKAGVHYIGKDWTAAQVLAMWDAETSQRTRRAFSLYLSLRTGHITIRTNRELREARMALAGFVGTMVAIVLVFLLAVQLLDPEVPNSINNEAHHECVRLLGEDCKL